MEIEKVLNQLQSVLKNVTNPNACKEMDAQELLLYSTEQIAKAASEGEAGAPRLQHLTKQVEEARSKLTDSESKALVEIYDVVKEIPAEADPMLTKLDEIANALNELKAVLAGKADDKDEDEEEEEEEEEEEAKAKDEDEEEEEEEEEDEKKKDPTLLDAAAKSEPDEKSAEGDKPAEEGAAEKTAASDDTPAAGSEAAADADAGEGGEAESTEKRDVEYVWPSDANSKEFREGGKPEDNPWGNDPGRVQAG